MRHGYQRAHNFGASLQKRVHRQDSGRNSSVAQLFCVPSENADGQSTDGQTGRGSESDRTNRRRVDCYRVQVLGKWKLLYNLNLLSIQHVKIKKKKQTE